MQLRVLVVDDSRFYRNRVAEMLAADGELQVIDMAENGAEAVKKVLTLRPDVVTMDIEMPIMDGISAVREIMKARPTPILMFSSLTTEGAQATLAALEAGALDFLPKRFEDIARDKGEVARELCRRLKMLGRKRLGFPRVAPAMPAAKASAPTAHVSAGGALRNCRLLLIGASTGGPAALQTILSSLPENFAVPIVVIQHMPSAFTGPFATRLNSLCKVQVDEAKDGDLLKPGRVLIAPGGKQLELHGAGAGFKAVIRESKAEEQYKPSVDVGFNSAAAVIGKGVLAIVLTGMGADGKKGAASLKAQGSSVWAQDEESCVVYGMPQAVVDAGLADRVLSLPEIAATLAHGT